MKPRSSGIERSSSATEREQAGARIGTTVLGSFRLLRVIGRGSFATAYLALQQGTDRQAVVKIPHRHLLESESDERIRSRFAAELRASTRVVHSHIATVYTAGDTDDGVPAIAMEHVPGRVLSARLKAEAPLPPASLGNLGAQIASALSAIHAAGIIHRDVTPRNIVASTDVEDHERYVLLDFGIAKLPDLAGCTLGPMGTPRYMPREQVYGRAVPRSDMFGLGAILWWTLTGQEYLAGVEDVQSVLRHQVEQIAAPDPRRIRPSIPAPVARMVARLLHPNPDRRPAARAFADVWPALVNGWIDEWSEPGAQGDSSATCELDEAPMITCTVDSMADTNATAQSPVSGWSPAGRPDANPVLEPNPLSGSGSGSGSSLGSSSAPGVSTLERFVGLMPEWLQDLHEAVQQGSRTVVLQVCRRIGDSARLMGVDQLAHLTDILGQLAEHDMLEQGAGFAVEIEEEFHKAFRELLFLHRVY